MNSAASFWAGGVNRRVFANQGLGRNFQPVMQGADHGHAEGALVVEHFGNFAFAAQIRREVAGAQARLLHAEANGLDGTGRRNGEMLVLKFFHQERPQLQFGLLRGAGLGVHQALDPRECGGVFGLGLDDFGFHGGAEQAD